MRYINRRFTYLLTYILCSKFGDHIFDRLRRTAQKDSYTATCRQRVGTAISAPYLVGTDKRLVSSLGLSFVAACAVSAERVQRTDDRSEADREERARVQRGAAPCWTEHHWTAGGD